MSVITLVFNESVNVSLQKNESGARDSVFSNNPQLPADGNTSSDYIFIAKKADVSNSRLSGYYAEVEMKNILHDKAELFAVGAEVGISSK